MTYPYPYHKTLELKGYFIIHGSLLSVKRRVSNKLDKLQFCIPSLIMF